MKTVIVYYSFTGHTAALANALGKELRADLVEIRDRREHGKFYAYTIGCIKALRMAKGKIQYMAADLSAYDTIIIMSPVWAGHTPPAINRVLDYLPEGKDVEVRMISASGESQCKEKVQTLIEAKGCKLTSFIDIKSM